MNSKRHLSPNSMPENKKSDSKNPLELIVIVLLVLGIGWLLWIFAISPALDQGPRENELVQNLEIEDQLKELDETDERKKAIRQQLTEDRDTSKLFTYQGKIVDIQRDRIITRPHSLPNDLIDFPGLFPSQVTIFISSNTLYQSVAPIDRERANEILAEYNRQVSQYPAGTDPSQLPPYPNNINDIQPLSFTDLVNGDVIRVLASKPIVGDESIQASVISVE